MITNFTNQLDLIHKELLTEFEQGMEEDIQIAQELEQFLNYAIYNTGAWAETDVQTLSGLLTQELLENITNDQSLKNLFTTKGKNSRLRGKRGERAFAEVIMRILRQEIPQLEKSAASLASQLLSSNQHIIVGKQSTTIQLTDSVIQAIQKYEQASIKPIQDQLYYRTRYTSGKNDIDTSILEIVKGWSPQAQKLIGLTASVKNYNDFRVHLENLNAQKAYLAIVTQLKNITENEAQALYIKYYLSKEIPADLTVTGHLQHLSMIYALTGFGQYAFDTISAQLILQKYSRFLMYNNASASKIIIKSTKDIVAQLIGNSSNKSSLSIRESKGLQQVSYYFNKG